MILGYARVSSTDQAKDDRSSLQTQTDVIEGFARTRGADKFDLQIYTDAGVSGAIKLAERAAGRDLLADMKPGDTVIASKLDRMFRSASDAIDMFEVFKSRGVDLVLYDISNEPVSSGVGKLIMTILAAVADMERVRIKERTMEGRKAAKAKGRVVGNVPFGYKKTGTGGESYLVPDTKEQKAWKIMKELHRNGRGYADIAMDLYGKGLLSRAGTAFTPMAVRRAVMEPQQ